jgi:hypothetical protein
MADKFSADELIALARKHKVALAVGAGVLLVLSASSGGQSGGGGWGSGSGGQGQGPSVDAGVGVEGPDGTDSSGGFDKRAYDNAQARDSSDHANKIDSIRGVEQCAMPDGTYIEVEAGTCAR